MQLSSAGLSRFRRAVSGLDIAVDRSTRHGGRSPNEAALPLAFASLAALASAAAPAVAAQTSFDHVEVWRLSARRLHGAGVDRRLRGRQPGHQDRVPDPATRWLLHLAPGRLVDRTRPRHRGDVGRQLHEPVRRLHGRPAQIRVGRHRRLAQRRQLLQQGRRHQERALRRADVGAVVCRLV